MTLGSVEFYVIIFTAAALAVALIALPQNQGPVITSFASGHLEPVINPDATPAGVSISSIESALELRCLPDGTVELRRYGLPPLPPDSIVALAITRKGFDLSIQERITAPHGSEMVGEPMVAVFNIGHLANERYHLKYNSDPTSTFAIITFRNRPGLRSSCPLRRG